MGNSPFVPINGPVDGWTFSRAVVIDRDGGVAKLEEFTIHGRCTHGKAMILQDLRTADADCGCTPTPSVRAKMSELASRYKAFVGKSFDSSRH